MISRDDAILIIEKTATLNERLRSPYYSKKPKQNPIDLKTKKSNWLSILAKNVGWEKKVIKLRKIGPTALNSMFFEVSLSDSELAPSWARRFLKTFTNDLKTTQIIDRILLHERDHLKKCVRKLKNIKIAQSASNSLIHYLRSEIQIIVKKAGLKCRPDDEDLKKHPVLVRLLFQRVLYWEKFTREWLSRLDRDFKEIGILQDVQSGLGDSHQDGKTVLLLSFKTGTQIIYKPRNLAADIAFLNIAGRINELTSIPYFHIRKIISHTNYGWDEFVPSNRIRVQNLSAYGRSLGALLKLIELLGGKDFHADNIGSNGTMPVAFDCEGLMHPATINNRSTNKIREMASIAHLTPLHTGILSVTINKNGKISDLSHVARICKTMSNKQKNVFANSVVAGYARIENIIGSNQSLQRLILKKFKKVKARYLPTPTHLYQTLMDASLNSKLLTDGRDRSIFIEALWRKLPDHPDLTKMIVSEISSIENLDIPIFWARAADSHLRLSNGTFIKNIFRETSLAQLKHRLTLCGKVPILSAINHAIIRSSIIKNWE